MPFMNATTSGASYPLSRDASDGTLAAWIAFRGSMSGKGNCYDNSAVETVFKTIKVELLWQRSWRTRRDAEMAIFEYINGFYNPRRRHSALGWKSPLAFERKVA